MAGTGHSTDRPRHNEAAARRDRALRQLRRATAVAAGTAAVSVGGVTALAAATRPGHDRSSDPPAPATAAERSAGALQPPPAAPTASDDEPSAPSDDEQAPPAPGGGDQQQAPAPAPAPPPVTSGGS